MSHTTRDIIARLRQLGDENIAAHSRRFFKTGKGQYGEGDRFFGIRVPVIRQCVRDLKHAPMEVVLEILQSPFHEARLLALLILVARYKAARSENEKERIYSAYLQYRARINNWDLVDCSAEHIVGGHLLTRDRRPLYKLADSEILWDRRIAVMATFHFIRNNDFQATLNLAAILREDEEDLIHKAVGWMLREVGKRDRFVDQVFLILAQDGGQFEGLLEIIVPYEVKCRHDRDPSIP